MTDDSSDVLDCKMTDSTAGSSDGLAVANDIQEVAKITAVQIKVPPFWKINPALWFCQLEAQFQTSRTTSDKSKYFAVVGAIETSILNQVSDLVLNPPDTNMYGTLKARLLDVFADSEQSRLKKLLGEIELADQKPSFLLREMRNLAGTSITAELLKTLWLQRLPTNIQQILSISTEEVDRLAVMADKIFETTNHSEIHKISSRSNDGNLELKVEELSKQISELQSRFSRKHLDDKKSFKTRSRSRSQTPASRTLNQTKDAGRLCWYHSRWGVKATKCIGECNFNPASLN